MNAFRFSLLFAIAGMVNSAAVLAETPIESALKKTSAMERDAKYEQIIALLSPYADSQNGRVEFTLANAYMNLAIDGREVKSIKVSDVQPAIDFAQKAAKHGYGSGFNLLYLIYGNGFGVPADSAKAIGYLRQGVAAGDQGAILNYAVMRYVGVPPVAQDVDDACTLFRGLLKKDSTDAVAQYYLGVVSFLGQCGQPVDKKAGVGFIRSAAIAGVRDAERDMGKNYEFGWADPVDLRTALDWYEKAAGHGDPHAEWRIGMAYVNGELRAKDSVKAVEYLRRAADAGDRRGLVDMGVMYVTGDGVEKDYGKARELYEQAARLGVAHAYRELAAMAVNGEGTAVDVVKARVLYLQSIELGEPDNPAIRKVIESRMDPAQVKLSSEQFEQWKSQRKD